MYPVFELALWVLRNINPQRRTVCSYYNVEANLQQWTGSVLENIYRGSVGVVGRQNYLFSYIFTRNVINGEVAKLYLRVNRLLFCLLSLAKIIEATVIFVVLCWETNLAIPRGHRSVREHAVIVCPR